MFHAETLEHDSSTDTAALADLPSSPLRARSSVPPQFREALEQVYRTVTAADGPERERSPTAFEIATGEALWRAYELSQQRGGLMRAVSAATGSGKTQGAIALAYAIAPAHSAFVVKEIAECHRVWQTLDALMPGRVAIMTHIHAAKAQAHAVAEFERETGLKVTQRFTPDEFKAAPVVVTTHSRWRREIESGNDLGVRACNGEPRAVVVVDEDPELEQVFVTQPEDVSALASILTDKVLGDEARAFGFGGPHPAVLALTAIHDRMRAIKDRVDLARLWPSEDLITAEEAGQLFELTYEDIALRVRGAPDDARAKADHGWHVLQFLKAAAEGRVFYSKADGGAFYAYAFAVGPQPHTIVLDGTADVNALYSIGGAVSPTDAPKPDYGAVRLHHVAPPEEFARKIRPNALLRDADRARPFVAWFMEFLEARTEPGQRCLVYGKLDLIRLGLHTQWHDADASQPATVRETTWKGRHIQWAHFGSGRGSNRYKDATAYFRIADFYPKRAVTVAKIGSAGRVTFSPAELRRLSSGTTTEARYRRAYESHLIVNNKQDAARCAIRNLDDCGRAPRADLYFIDADLTMLVQYRAAMFPGSPEFALLGPDGNPRTVSRRQGTTGPMLLAELLASTPKTLLTSSEVLEVSGIKTATIRRALASSVLAPVVRVRGWQKVTLREAGLSGKGWALKRIATNCKD